MTEKQKAEQAYAARRAEIAALRDCIGQELDAAHTAAVGDGVTWEHVGSLEHVKELLKNALGFLSGMDQTEIDEFLEEAKTRRSGNG